MTKNPTWVQFPDDAWGEAVSGGSDHVDWLCSLDAPERPASALDPLPDVNAPLVPTWLHAGVVEAAVGPHGLTFQRHTDMLTEVARLDAHRRAAVGDLRDQIARQHREAKQELDDFERSDRFQAALKHYLEAAGAAFESIAAATPENQAAVVYQQQVATRWNGLRNKLIDNEKAPIQAVGEFAALPPDANVSDSREPMLNRGKNRRCFVEVWVKWWAREIANDKADSTKDDIADKILTRAEKFGYESSHGPLSMESVMRMIPSGLTGGRGRKPGSQSKK